MVERRRKEYSKFSMHEIDMPSDPDVAFRDWLNKAAASEELEPLSMVLSTVFENKPSSRVVLLRGIKKDGLRFYGNYYSRKALALSSNRYAALNFFWPSLERQVRVEGEVSKISEEESDAYFESRPRESQIGAWSSPQSEVIKDRQELENAFQENTERFQGFDVKRPPNWGGFRLLPEYYEFWQGRPGRLHDRLCYLRDKEDWVMKRLAP